MYNYKLLIINSFKYYLFFFYVSGKKKILELYVLSAYPCRSIENDDENISESVNRHVNVEMDPVGEFEIRNEINKLNMKVVGWYHSHPKFAPDPSFVDIENQLNYQTLFREKNNIDEPFVGVIVGRISKMK